MSITMSSRNMPAFFKGKVETHLWEHNPNTYKMFFRDLPITFHTIQMGKRRWIPKPHKPIKVNAWTWAIRRRDGSWSLQVGDCLYTNISMPHCTDGNCCLNPQKVGDDYSRGVWPMNTIEDYERAKNRIIQLLGGINLDSLLTGISWGFDPKLVLPDKLWHDGVLDIKGTCDFHAKDWSIDPEDEEEDDYDD